MKRYAHETGSLWVRSLTDPEAGHDLFTAHIPGIEVVAAIARKIRTREIAVHDATAAISTFKNHFTTQYQIVVLTTTIVDHAMALAEQHTLRGYDATQLASALAVHTELTASGVSDLVFISANAELNTVAQTAQLVVQTLMTIHDGKMISQQLCWGRRVCKVMGWRPLCAWSARRRLAHDWHGNAFIPAVSSFLT